VILDQATFLGMKDEMPDLRTVGEPIFYNAKPDWVAAEKAAAYRLGGTAVGMRKECGDLKLAVNKALADMDADGTRKAILTKYGVWSDDQAKLMK